MALKPAANVSPITAEAVFAVTPKGTAQWCKWNEVDNYGNFAVDLYLSKKDTDELIAKFEAIRDAAEAEVTEAKKPIKGLADVFKEKEGKRYFQFKVSGDKLAEKGADKVTVFNVYGKEDKTFNALIGNGSTIKVKYMAKAYYMNSTKQVGVSLRLMSMQLIELVEFSSGGNDFGDESDGVESDFNDCSSDAKGPVNEPENDDF
ncbi:MAG: hypothetical protein JHC33_03415 [Ignisphaera sp.]|nr:hypothetical protein [Ignisphaera sp.]